NHAALGSAKGDVDYGALPGHPACQGANFIERNIRRVANSALARTTRLRVLHPEAGEHLDAPVVHGHGEMHNNLAGWITQHTPEALVQIQFACCKVESSSLRFPGVDLLLESDGCHSTP